MKASNPVEPPEVERHRLIGEDVALLVLDLLVEGR